MGIFTSESVGLFCDRGGKIQSECIWHCHKESHIGDYFRSHTVLVFTEGSLGHLIEKWIERSYFDKPCTVAEEQNLYSGCRERHQMMVPSTCCGRAGRTVNA